MRARPPPCPLSLTVGVEAEELAAAALGPLPMRDRSGEARRDRAAIELRRVLLEEAHVLEGVTARLPRAARPH